MDTFYALLNGFTVALSPTNLGIGFLGCLLGTVIGLLPGIGPVNGIAILVPLAFSLGLGPTSTLILMTCVYYGCMFGGSISSILLNIPGDEPAIMTTLDGYPMAKAGKGANALAISAISSFVGGTIATLGLTIFAPVLAGLAIHFGPVEYLAMFVLAFLTITSTALNPVKALIGALLGLILGTVGLDPVSGVPRYTFGDYRLFDGIDPIIAIIGLFAVGEILSHLAGGNTDTLPSAKVPNPLSDMKGMLKTTGATLRGSFIGFFIGILPGAGSTLAAYLAYTAEKRYSNRLGTFGKGDPRGVAAPEAANNAAAGASLIPMLTLGIPGGAVTAVMLTMLITMNITPGPLLFERQPDVVWGLVAALYIANIVLLILNLPLVGLFARLLSLPLGVLMPMTLMISCVGVYSISHSEFDLLVLIAFGVLGLILRKLRISLVPVVIGLLLGGPMETNLRRALSISGGDIDILFHSTIANIMYGIGLALAILAIVAVIRTHRIMPVIHPQEHGSEFPKQ
jgi:putative tricarboxylic transport membrane protein